MNITLYRNTSEEAVVSKSISTYGTYTCKLQEPCTLEQPHVRMQLTSFNPAANYMYIDLLGRYYYITAVEYLEHGLVELTGSVDPLMSFANSIRGLDAIVDRNEFDYDDYMVDPDLLMGVERVNTTEYIGHIEDSTQYYLLNVAGV